MLRTRVIPCLLLSRGGLVKTVGFGKPRYVGDPINAVRIFNEKEVDELVFLDIDASREGRGPSYETVVSIAREAFMPLAYGGGVTTIEQVERLLAIGVEKIIVNSAAVPDPGFLAAIAARVGSQSLVASIDVKRGWFGRMSVRTHGGTRAAGADPVRAARDAEAAGAGEILLTSIDRDGTRTGYDLELIESVSSAVSIPVVACGGAGQLTHLREAVDRGASAVAAGSLFVFHGKHRAVLITYPEYAKLQELMS